MTAPAARFTAAHIVARIRPPRMNRRRLALLSAVAFAGNIFIAPASLFQNNYLSDVRGFSGGMIAVFSIAVGTPASIGLIVGGRIADTRGRRRLIAVTVPLDDNVAPHLYQPLTAYLLAAAGLR